MEVRRVHSDGAAEMLGSRRWCEARGIYRTFTSGSDWKANGRAEAEVGVIRRCINTLIRSSGDGEELWPLMAKHVGERRGRLQLQALGFSTPRLMPWGRSVMVTTKGWDDFQGHWRLRKKKGLVRGPDPEMSLTSGGHLVEIEKGKYIRTDDLVQAEDPPSLEDVVNVKERSEPACILDGAVVPTRRLHEKTSLACVSLAVLQDRLLRGQAWANEEFSRLEADLQEGDGAAALIYDLDCENQMIETLAGGHGVACRKVEAQASQVAEEEGEVFLQTRTVSLQEVRRSLPLWIPPLQTEIDNFDNNHAIERIDEKETRRIMEEAQQKGQRAELIPGMGVFTRKAGDGRRRARVVCCGNYMEAREGDEVYATGADSTQLRAILRLAALCQWECLSLDVKSAFLLAPKAQGETVIARPPKILEEAGLIKPGEHWLVNSAMYGLVTSPKDWSSYRDAELQKMEGVCTGGSGGEEPKGRCFSFRPMEDPNLWAIQEVVKTEENGTKVWGQVFGHMIVYVDDVLMVGPRAITEVASRTIREFWSTSEPEYAEVGGASMRFLGIEIQRLKEGSYFLHQECYTKEILDRHPGASSSPFVKVPEEKEEEEAVSLPKVREAEKITGELLWLSGKTRPDISWAVMKMAQNAVKKPRWTVELGRAVIAYLRFSIGFGLHYTIEVPKDSDPDLQRTRPRHAGTVEVLVDASFSPGDSHSISGTIILFAGCPVQWESRKQPLMALSTAEAELTALVEGLQTGRSVQALIKLLVPSVDIELYNDNRAAVVLASGSGGGWRTRHLRIRARCIAEALARGEATLSHRCGSLLWADALTKPLPTQSLNRFCEGVWLGCSSMKADDQGGPCEVHVLESATNVRVLKSISLLAVGAALLPTTQAAETCEIKETRGEDAASSWADQGWVLLLAGLVCLLHIIKDVGWEMAKRLCGRKDQLKVKLLSEQASLPSRMSTNAAGWDVSAASSVEIAPGDRKLIPLGLAFEMPDGCYGRLAPRSSLALRGVDVAGGVIDSDYRGEVKVILVNNGPEVLKIDQGDRIAQLVLEKYAKVDLSATSSLTWTQRGESGFGSSGLAVRRLSGAQSESSGQVASDTYDGGEGQRETPNDGEPTHVFFDGVFFAEAGESMVDFVQRLKRNELYDFRWMFPEVLFEHFHPDRLHGSSRTYLQQVGQGTMRFQIHKHPQWRKKLYDSEVSAPTPESGITAGVVSLGWREDGVMFARVDNRRGSRSMCYLTQPWKGVSLFYSWDKPSRRT